MMRRMQSSGRSVKDVGGDELVHAMAGGKAGA
jgi:hypothetical protein